MSMLMLTSLTYVETEQYLVVLFLVTAPRLIVRAGRGHRYAHAFIWKNKELSVFCLSVCLSEVDTYIDSLMLTFKTKFTNTF